MAKAIKGTDSLNERQTRFCEEYMIDFNGTQAAIRAGYSKQTANEQASQLLAKLNIQTYLNNLRQQSANDFGVTKKELVDELKRIAFFDIRKVFNIQNELIPIIDIDNDSAAAIAGIETDEIYEFNPIKKQKELIGYTRKIKVASKIAAIERVSKMLGYDAPEKKELSGSLTWQEEKTYEAE